MFNHFTIKSVEKLSQRKQLEKVKKAKILLSQKSQKIETIRRKILETTQFPPPLPVYQCCEIVQGSSKSLKLQINIDNGGRGA